MWYFFSSKLINEICPDICLVSIGTRRDEACLARSFRDRDGMGFVSPENFRDGTRRACLVPFETGRQHYCTDNNINAVKKTKRHFHFTRESIKLAMLRVAQSCSQFLLKSGWHSAIGKGCFLSLVTHLQFNKIYWSDLERSGTSQ